MRLRKTFMLGEPVGDDALGDQKEQPGQQEIPPVGLPFLCLFPGELDWGRGLRGVRRGAPGDGGHQLSRVER